MTKLDVKICRGAVRFSVRLQPRSSGNAIDGVRDGTLRIRVSAPPVDGAANDALLRLLAQNLGVPARDVTIVGGAASRNKVVQVAGIEPDRIINLVS